MKNLLLSVVNCYGNNNEGEQNNSNNNETKEEAEEEQDIKSNTPVKTEEGLITVRDLIKLQLEMNTLKNKIRSICNSPNIKKY